MLAPVVFRLRSYPLMLAALVSALALLLGQAVAPRVPGFAAGEANVVGGDPAEALAQLYRQDARVLRVLDRPAPSVDLTRLWKGAVGKNATPGALAPSAPWDVVATYGPALRSVFILGDRSCRGPPAA